MKIRTGFVSNSSSSSFIVQIRDKWKLFKGEDKTPITKKEIKLLIEHGFYYCYVRDPMFLMGEDKEKENIEIDDIETKAGYENVGKKCPKNKINNPEYMGLRVVCNQDFPISFLVYYDIPFTASVHYGDYTYVYRRGWKDVIVMNNIGLQNDYGDRALDLFKNSKKEKSVTGEIAWKIPKKHFLIDFSKEEIADQIKGSKLL